MKKIFTILICSFLLIGIFPLNIVNIDAKPNQTSTFSYVYPKKVVPNQEPVIDGVIDSSRDEWFINSGFVNKINFTYGTVYFVHDDTRLYILFNMWGDTVEDNPTSPDSLYDYFSLTFDVNGDGIITPGVDIRYSFSKGTYDLKYQYYITSSSYSFLQAQTFSIAKEGFGCSIQDKSFKLLSLIPFEAECNSHRIFELAIDINEMNGFNNVWSRFGFSYYSPNPSIDFKYPENMDFSALSRLSLSNLDRTITRGNSDDAVEYISGVEFQDNIEVYQTVQTSYNYHSLASGKATVARVFLNVVGSNPRPLTALVYLFGERNGEPLPGSPLVKRIDAPIAINKSDESTTPNFRLPTSWTQGDITLRSAIVDFNGHNRTHSAMNFKFLQRKNPVIYIVTINNGTAENPFTAPDWIIDLQISAFRAVFPSAYVKFVKKPWTVIGACTSCNYDQINVKLNEYYNSLRDTYMRDRSGFRDFPDQIYGFAPFGGGLADPTWWNNHQGRVSVGYWGTNGEFTMAHEINHNLDRSSTGTWGRHVASQGSETAFGCGASGPDPNWPRPPFNDDINILGFDTRTNIVVPFNKPDLMSYCGDPTTPTQWISGYRWEKWMSLFPVVSVVSPPANNKVESTSTGALPFPILLNGDFFVLSTSFTNNGNTGNIDSVFKERDSIFSGMSESATGNASVEVLDNSGIKLKEYFFNISFENVDHEVNDFSNELLKIPFNANANLLRLKYQSTILDEVKNHNSLPSITINSPSADSVWQEGLFTVDWTATDSMTSDLSTKIYYSADNGEKWTPLSPYLQNTNSYTVDSSFLEGSKTAKIRLEVTNGFNTSIKDSVTFTVTDNPPVINITSPIPKVVFNASELISFSATAFDYEGLEIPDNQTYWQVDGEYFLQGKDFSTILTNGTHKITFIAVDHKGVLSEQSFTVYIGSDDVFVIGDFVIEKNIAYIAVGGTVVFLALIILIKKLKK